MKWEYLQVYPDANVWIAFDGNSKCDGDKSLLVLLNRLGQDRWECFMSVGKKYYYLKRSLP